MIWCKLNHSSSQEILHSMETQVPSSDAGRESTLQYSSRLLRLTKGTVHFSEVQINAFLNFCLSCRWPHTGVRRRKSIPAVHHNGTSIRGVAGFHPSQKSQERGGVLRHAVVRPRCELELADLPFLTGAILQRQKSTESNVRYQDAAVPCLCCVQGACHSRGESQEWEKAYLMKGERSNAECGQFNGIE